MSQKRPTAGDAAADDVNDRFHDAYDDARRDADRQAPVWVVLPDTLVVLRGDQRREYALSPPAFHFLKSVCHAPVAAFLLLRSPKIRTLAKRMSDCLAGLDTIDLPMSVKDQARQVLTATKRFADGDGRDLESLGTEVRAALLQCIDAATVIQVRVLDETTRQILADMTEEERHTFMVVVTGDHQARQRSLPMQYFQRLFGEKPGADDRVLFGESVGDEKEAVALIGSLRLNRAIAATFFGDETRLQRDILGDAAHQRLRELEVPRL